MSITKCLPLIFLIACITQRAQVHARRDHYFEDDDWRKSGKKIVSYMGCDIKERINYNTGFVQPVCNLTVEMPNSYGSFDRLSCNIERAPFTNRPNLYYEIKAVMNANAVILYGTGKNWAKVRIVRMRECRYRDIYFEVDALQYNDFGTAEINVTLNEDSFNVFYEDKQECRNGVCVDIYDFSGRLLEGPYDVPRPTGSSDRNAVTYVFGEQYTGKISLIYDYEHIKLVSYGGSNASDVLFQLPRHEVTVLSISTKKKLFGLCYRWNKYRRAACLQYDNKGKQMVNSTFVYPKDWTSFRVSNRYEGGFTAMATNCTVDQCDNEHDIYHVEIRDKKLKYHRPIGFFPRLCRSRVGDKSEIEIGFDYATYFNCKPSIRGQTYTFMFKSWCSEFIRCRPVVL